MSLRCPPELRQRIGRLGTEERHLKHQLKSALVQPLFEALGWNVHNTRLHPTDHEVVAAIGIGGTCGATPPDYTFRINRRAVFHLAVSTDGVHTRDLRRYGYTQRMSFSVMADREHLTIFSCTDAPRPDDPPDTGLLARFSYGDCVREWPNIHKWLSKAQCLRDTQAAAAPHDGAAQSLVDSLRDWREVLHQDLRKKNPTLIPSRIRTAAKRTIDRLLYLRICEAKNIEPFGLLTANKDNIYRSMARRFRAAEKAYGTGLFHFQPNDACLAHPDDWTLRLNLSDGALGQILEQLYSPDSPILFDCLPDDILGQLHEQLLGEEFDSSESGQVPSRTARRHTGVYYTPSHIVDHVVERTLGPLTHGRSPSQMAALRVLDPACGSGSFLLSAYQHLLDAHLRWYTSNNPDQWLVGACPTLIRLAAGEECIQLSVHERARILEQHIFGVDLDTQAVDLTRLSLILKALQVHAMMPPVHGCRTTHPLVRPEHNIRQGNALLGSEYVGHDGDASLAQQGGPLHPINWDTRFDGIAKQGFDVIVGNPPWGQKGIGKNEQLKAHLQEKYPSSRGIYDLFRPFVEKGINLLKKGGRFGMVLPDIVLLKNYPSTRKLMLDQLEMTDIDWWAKPFTDATIDAVTILGLKKTADPQHAIRVNLYDKAQSRSHTVLQSAFGRTQRFVFNLGLTSDVLALLDRVAECPRYRDFMEAHEGVHSGNMRAALFRPKAQDATCRPILVGRGEMNRYHLRWAGTFVHLGLPKLKGQSFSLGRPEWYARDKLLIRRTGDYIMAAVDREERYASNNMFIAFPTTHSGLNIDGLCALLNSPFMTWYFRAIHPRTGRAFAELKIHHLMDFPLPPSDTPESLLSKLNKLGHRRAALASTAGEQFGQPDSDLQKQIDGVDVDIANCVGKIFKYTDAEQRQFPVAGRHRARRRSTS